MISYSDFDFATAPRTGSTWFVQAAAIAGLGERTRAHVHIPHPNTPTMKVTHVRHPCRWLESYYRVVYPAYLAVPCVDAFRTLKGRTFPEFVRNYLKRSPGAIGAMFTAYNATAVYRLEDQPMAFLELMRLCGVACDAAAVWSHPVANRTTRRKFKWSVSLWDAVVAAEKEMIRDFAYETCFDPDSVPTPKQPAAR